MRKRVIYFFQIIILSDSSAGLSIEANNDARQLMIQAGAKPITWQAVMASCCPDSTAPEYYSLYDVVIKHGNGVSHADKNQLLFSHSLFKHLAKILFLSPGFRQLFFKAC